MTSNQPWWLAWPPAEVAAAILPLYESPTRSPAEGVPGVIVKWCKTGNYQPTSRISGGSTDAAKAFDDPDCAAIAEALQVLEHARLLMVWRGEYTFVGLTRLGRHTLATNAVRRHLGLSDAPPTP